MAQMVEGNTKAFTAAEALATRCRVMLNSSGNILYADAGHEAIGVTEAAIASGDDGLVRLRTAAGTRKMTAAGAFSINDVIYAADDGRIDDDPAGVLVGRAIEAATAAGDIVEILPAVSGGVGQGAGDQVELIGGTGGLAALDLVYISDQTDNVMTALKAQATSGGRFADYIVPQAIGAAATGLGLKVFLLSAIDTSAGSVGDPVYLDDTTAGGYDLTKPTNTDKVQIVGRIVEDHATTGAILFDLSGPQQVVHNHNSNAEGGIMTGPHINTGLQDANGLPILNFTATASAVNEITIANAAAGNAPVLSVVGDDTDIDLTLTPKGAGVVNIHNSSVAVGAMGAATTSAADSLAIPVTHSVVAKTTGADAEALTLADGVAGQVLTIYLTVDGGGDGTLTPTTCSGFATIVFADAGDLATLLFVDGTVGWTILGTAGVAAPPVISQ